MKMSQEKPKIYQKLAEKFGVDWDNNLIITYGDTIHCKIKNLEPHVIIHEEVHIKQQKEYGVAEWWNRYIDDEVFRLSQEVEAYKKQVNYIREHTEDMNRQRRRIWLKQIAIWLSGPMYGNLLTYEKAVEVLK